VFNSFVNYNIEYVNIDNIHASWRHDIIIRGFLFSDEFAVSSITMTAPKRQEVKKNDCAKNKKKFKI
jgi:hypothetical protein